MVLSYLFHRGWESLIFNTWISIVLQDVLFFHFEGSNTLLGESFLILKLFVLALKELVGLSSFGKFLIHKFVLTSQGLDIFSEFCRFGRFYLNYLSLVLRLLSEVLIFLTEHLDFIFSFVESPLEIIFFASDHWDLVLHVAEVKDLFFELLFAHDKFLSFVIEITLHLVQACV